MNREKTIFAQLMALLPQRQFQRYVLRYGGNRNVRSFSCWDQFLCMAFAQLTYRRSLRDIETCLRAVGVKQYHLGIRGKVSRSTLADANDNRDWRIFADFAQLVIHDAQRLLTGDDFAIELENAVYALDATVIEVCLTMFPWAFWTERETKGGLKVHTLLDVKRNVPVFIDITERKVHDTLAFDKLVIEPGAFYLMDRAYLDWRRLHRLTLGGAFFVIRTKRNTAVERVCSRPVDKSTGVRSDQVVRTVAKNPVYRRKYPSRLRRVSFFDAPNNRRLVFLTNNFQLPAPTIAELYKCRWQIELFFKWIKQHLRIEKFYGNSKNAIKTQIWIAVTVYVLVAIAKKRLRLPHSLYGILQVFSVALLEKKPILEAFAATPSAMNESEFAKQIDLFEKTTGQ